MKNCKICSEGETLDNVPFRGLVCRICYNKSRAEYARQRKMATDKISSMVKARELLKKYELESDFVKNALENLNRYLTELTV
jgi:hypothetical protein